MYEIEYLPQALQDLKWFSKREQNVIVDGIEANLRYEPTTLTRNRKPTRPNAPGEWELRIGQFRVFYDVDVQVRIVEIQRIGQKRGSRFLFRGREEEV